MTVREYMDIGEKIAPTESAYEWDHVGLMTGDPSQEVTGVLLCLDLTKKSLEEALDKDLNLIITHHPILFDPVYSIREDQASNKRITAAIRNNIAVLSYHTNLDLAPAPYGINYNLAAALGLKNIQKTEDDFHYYGEFEEAISTENFAAYINKMLDTKTRCLYNKGLEAPVKRIGVSCGAYDENSTWLKENGCDALVTGEAKQSELVDLSFEDFTVYISGHYATEMPGLRALADILPGRIFISEYTAGDGALII